MCLHGNVQVLVFDEEFLDVYHLHLRHIVVVAVAVDIDLKVLKRNNHSFKIPPEFR